MADVKISPKKMLIDDWVSAVKKVDPSGLKEDDRKIFDMVRNHKNIPKTPTKFTNFCIHNLKVKDDKIINRIWSHLSSAASGMVGANSTPVKISSTKSSATKSSATKSSATKSSVTKSSETKASASKPSASKSSATKPSATKSPATKPSANNNSANNSSATKSPANNSSATKSPAVKSAVAKSPATKAPAPKSPATKSAAAKSPATKSPATKASDVSASDDTPVKNKEKDPKTEIRKLKKQFLETKSPKVKLLLKKKILHLKAKLNE